jgi:O-antigen ligase
VNSLLAALFASALVFIQCSISGTRMAFSLPAYAILAVAGVLSFFARPQGARRPGGWCLGVTAVFFAYVLARTATSPVDYLARTDHYMVIACLLVYGLTAVYFTGRTERLAVVWVLLALAAAEVVIATRQFAYADHWMPFGFIRSNIVETRRASGMFNNPIHLAGYLEAVAPFALAIAFWGSRKMWVRLLAGYVAAVSYFGIALTGSRGGWLSSLFSLLIFVVLSLYLIRKTNRPRFPAALYLSLIGILLVLALAPLLLQRDEMLNARLGLLAKTDRKAGEVYDVRQHNWAAALAQWREAPWLGTGAGTHLYYGRKYRHPALQSDPVHAHSDYLELLAEYGLAGAAGMLAFLLVHVGSGLRGCRELTRLRVEEPYRASPELAINVGALSALSSYFAHSAVDFNLHLPGNALLFAFIFGVLANPSRPLAEDHRREEEYPDPSAAKETSAFAPIWARLPIAALGIWMLWSGTPKIPAEALCERARVSVREGQYDEAIVLAERALEKEKNNPYLYHHLGEAHRLRAMRAPQTERSPDLEAAERAYRAGLALFEQDVIVWMRLARTLDELGKYQEARVAYERAIQLDPNLGLPYTLLAKHLSKIGDSEKAERLQTIGRLLTDVGLQTYSEEDLLIPGTPGEKPKEPAR